MNEPPDTETPAPDRADSRESARVLRNLIAAAGVFVVGALVVVFTSSDGEEGDAVSAGPPFGAVVADYVSERHERLDEIEGPVRAVVSFTTYLSDQGAREVVGGDVERWLVAAPGAAPRVTDDPGTWRREFAAAAREEAAELEALIPTVEDEEFLAQYRADVDRAQELAEALEAGDPVVYGVVITADAAALHRLRREMEVRLVDPVDPEARGEIRGLRPEETAVVGEPAERPLV